MPESAVIALNQDGSLTACPSECLHSKQQKQNKKNSNLTFSLLYQNLTPQTNAKYERL
jgi:hypothetical protein